MLFFFGIVFSVYGLINFYIIRRGLSIVPSEYKTVFIIVASLIAASYLAGRLIENVWISPISIVLIWIGSFWLAIMVYTFLFLIAVDLFRFINYLIPFFPSFITANQEHAKRVVAIIVGVLVLSSVIGGYINTKMIVVKKYSVDIKKNAGELKSLNLAVASDLHLGMINSYEFMYKVSEKINDLNPDVILLAGDIIDEDLGPVIKYDVGEHLKRLKSKYGVYAVTGNHEFIGGSEQAVNYLQKHNINVLRDQALKINNAFYLVGREDSSSIRFNGKQRKELSEIMKDVDKTFPVIMMDHQPHNLEQAARNGVDLQLSGHTHNGQLWPLNYIVEKIYELAWGYKVSENTHYYVSCGVGNWGPPVRTGSRPEIVNIKLNFLPEESKQLPE
ncbi:MAG: metallophosphoesterase [Ignavibacteria bacterium]|nr:MAG: metallophosphoesterase [Ignavibacteria bacterium]KAF0158561.1 MAG: metallophosphoesterase [Ignavibacteria bacterium]